MKYILIFIFLLTNIQIYAQTLYLASGASLYIQGASKVDGNVSASTPCLYVKGNVGNTGTIYNNSEMQVTANFANTGTFSSAGEEVLIGNTAQNISGNFTGANKFNHLMVDKTTHNVILGGNIEVGTSLSLLNGKLDLANFDATISAGANILAATNAKYVLTSGTGNLKQTVSASDVVFPVGKASYNPVTCSNSGTADVYAARVADEVGCGGANILATTYKVNKMWHLSEAVIGGSNATITTQWNTTDEDVDFVRANSGLSFYNGSEFELAETNSAALTPSLNVWTQTQSAQSTISPCLITSLAAITGHGVFCENPVVTLIAPTDAGATYQWRKNGINIPAETNQTYSPTQDDIYSALMASGSCFMLPKPKSVKFLLPSTSAIPATDGNARYATHECTDAVTNWTHYYDASPISGSYLLLSIKKNGNTNLGTVPTTASVLIAGDAVGAVTITSSFVQNPSGWTEMSRYWQFTPQNELTGSNVDVRFYFNNSDIEAVKTLSGNNTIIADNLFFYKVNTVSFPYDLDPINEQTNIPLATTYKADGIWVYAPSAIASTNTWKHSISGINGHSAEFSIGYFGGGGGGGTGNNAAPFTIELLSFRGYNENVTNRLFWATEMELNSDKFKVERGTENGTFEEIGEVKAVGNSNRQVNYAFNDNQFKANQNFYRLKMLDKDGSFLYSNVIEIATDKLNVTIYPNPAQNELFISGNFSINSKVSLSNMLGQEVLNRNLEMNNQTTVPLENISQGVYMLNILNEKNLIMYSEKLVKD